MSFPLPKTLSVHIFTEKTVRNSKEKDEECWRRAEARKRGKAVMRAKKAAHAERRQQENDAAEEVCSRIALLPEKIKIYTLYFEAKAYQEASSPPAEGCSAGRRTAKHQGVGQVQLGPKASYQRGQVSPLQVGSEGKPGWAAIFFCSSKQRCWF